MKPHLMLLPYKDTVYRWMCKSENGVAGFGKSVKEAYEDWIANNGYYYDGSIHVDAYIEMW